MLFHCFSKQYLISDQWSGLEQAIADQYIQQYSHIMQLSQYISWLVGTVQLEQCRGYHDSAERYNLRSIEQRCNLRWYYVVHDSCTQIDRLLQERYERESERSQRGIRERKSVSLCEWSPTTNAIHNVHHFCHNSRRLKERELDQSELVI